MGILQIISDNKKTFYDYETGAHISQRPRAILFVTFGCVTAVFIHSELKDFLAGLLNVLAIVSGFSFTSLFAIIAEKNSEKPIDQAILEDKLQKKRINKLFEEVFCNVSYFIIVATTAIVLTIINLTQSATVNLEIFWKIMDFFGLIVSENTVDPSIIINIESPKDYFVAVVAWLARAALFSIIAECIYTFMRIVVRLNVIFSNKFGR